MEGKTLGSATVKDVSSHEFNKAYAAHLKRSGKIELPSWVDIVKTGQHKELAPYDPDWYYIRAASIARKIYLRGGLGVGALRRIYGGSKRNGTRPAHFCRSSGSVARHILQQLQKVNIVDLDPKGGRIITSIGQRISTKLPDVLLPPLLRRMILFNSCILWASSTLHTSNSSPLLFIFLFQFSLLLAD